MEAARFWQRGAAGALVLLFLVAWPAAAQDQGLDPVLLANRDEVASAPDVEVRGVQLYRLPFSFHLRNVNEHPWGLRVTFPVSLSSLRITGVSDVGSFIDKLRIAAIIPGLEVEIPVGGRTLCVRSAKSDSGEAEIRRKCSTAWACARRTSRT